MAIDSRLLELMASTVKVYKRSGVDKYGKPSWSSVRSYRCRIMDADYLTRSVEVDDVVVAGKAIIGGVADCTTDDRLELPDGSSPVIVSVDQHTDESGSHHTTITFGR